MRRVHGEEFHGLLSSSSIVMVIESWRMLWVESDMSVRPRQFCELPISAVEGNLWHGMASTSIHIAENIHSSTRYR